MKNILVIGIAVFIIIGGAYVLFIKKIAGSKTALEADSVPGGAISLFPKIEEVSETAQTSDLSVRNQAISEETIFVDSLNLDRPGYINIHLDENGALGLAIGQSKVFSSGAYSDISIAVTNLKQGENKLLAMIHFEGSVATTEDDHVDEVGLIIKPFTVSKDQDANAETPLAPPSASNVKEFTIVAKQFSFEPNTITVKTGDLVRLRVKSVDVAHGIGISEFGVNELLSPGEEKTVEFTASKPGTFTIFCSVLCGSGHSGMRGTLIVE